MLSTEATVLTQSHLATFARCERRSYYRDVLKLDEGPSGVKSSEGTLLHAALAAAYRRANEHWSDYNVLAAAGMQAMSDMLAKGTYEYRGQEQPLSIKPDDGETITRLGDVFMYYMDKQFPNDIAGVKILAVEKPFELTIAGVTLSGTFDLVLERDGVIEVWDHKSVSDVHKSLRFLTLDVQVLVYELIAQTAMAHAYDEADGGRPLVQMVYNLIRRDRPPGFGSRELRRNKDGSVSKTNASTNVDDYLLQHRFGHTTRELLFVERELEELAYGVMTHWRQAGPGKRTVIKSGGEACATSCPYFARCGAELVGASVPNFVGVPDESTEDSD